jgi:DNA-binding HxlR family transcriptional regulator
MAERSYGQNCPIARALDILGERWTLLILRELLGGPRRYADLRAELPSIATNLLSQRLRLLVAEGVIEQSEVPPPVARTFYRLSDAGWRYVPPLIGALAAFGAERLSPDSVPVSPLTGFLAGVLLGFDTHRAREVDEDYRIDLDGRIFDIGVRHGALSGARGTPAVLVRAHASDLVRWRRSCGAAPFPRLESDGPAEAMARFTSVFGLGATV